MKAIRSRALLIVGCMTMASILGSSICVRAASPTPAASVSPTASATPSATATPSMSAADQKVLDRAKTWYGMLQTGKIDRSQLTKDMSDALTPQKVEAISQQLKPLGSPSSFTQKDSSVVGAYTVYHYNVSVTGGSLVMTFALDKSGQVAGLNLRAAGATP